MATYDLTTNIPNIDDLKTSDVLNCPYNGNYKSINLPAGTYKLECWGAQGGSYSSYYGGLGGYSSGILTLDAETTLFLTAGGQPVTNTTSQSMSPGGYNGGGQGAVRYYSSTYSYGQGGGGASDIRIGQNDLYARVIVAGGGGGSSSVNANTTKYGGGTSGGSPQSGFAGTATSAGTGGSFGVGASTYSSRLNYKYGSGGGGGGWYGGGAGNTSSYVNDSTTAYRDYNGGGSGYVYTSQTASNYPSGCLLNSFYYLSDASTKAGNTSFTSPTGSNETGHSGNGYVRITIIDISGPNIINMFIKKDLTTWISLSDGQIITTPKVYVWNTYSVNESIRYVHPSEPNYSGGMGGFIDAFYFTKNYTLDELTGNYTLINPVYAEFANFNNYIGYYFITNGGTTKGPNLHRLNGIISSTSIDVDMYTAIQESVFTKGETIGMVESTDRNAYPDNNYIDSIWYEYSHSSDDGDNYT